VSESIGASHGSLTAAPRWKRSPSLDLVHALNEHCLELLAGVAATDAVQASALALANGELWAKSSPEARKRAARMPFVVLDLHFADEQWWRSAIAKPICVVREPEIFNGLPIELSERLVQETLMFAWQMARSDRIAAQVSFAMRPPVAQMIGALTPRQVRDIASRRRGDIQLRWHEDGHFWGDLLLAAETGDDERVAELQLHAKLLLLGPLAHTCS